MTILFTMIQVIVAGYFIGAAVRHFRWQNYFLFGVDIALAIYIFLCITASIFK